MKGNFAAIVLVVFGIVALAVNLGYLSFDLVVLLRTCWPAALIALGVALYFTPGDTPGK
ncbi:MAG: putative rane protein [Proteobacteria bacterium]|nr:putative rane protein [Pseudomonadota bacterium]